MLVAATVAAPMSLRAQDYPNRVIKMLQGFPPGGVRARLESFGAQVRGSTAAEMRALVERQIALWAKLGKEANIQLE
jgi:tripartite-type tricarboxylate transporter receptor subunit TctC